MVQPSIPPREPPCNNNESRGSTIGRTAPVPPTTVYDYSTPPTSTQLIRSELQSTGTSTAPTTAWEHDSTYCTPRTRQWNITQATAKFSIALSLYEMISLPYKIWRRFETLILRTGYRRRQQKWRLHRFPFRMIWFLNHSEKPNDDDSSNIRTAVLKDIKIFWYYLSLPLSIIVTVLLNILYFVVCFPFIFRVAHRHRDVLEDAKTLERKRHESIEMLGPLPKRYGDLKLLEERERIFNERSSFNGGSDLFRYPLDATLLDLATH